MVLKHEELLEHYSNLQKHNQFFFVEKTHPEVCTRREQHLLFPVTQPPPWDDFTSGAFGRGNSEESAQYSHHLLPTQLISASSSHHASVDQTLTPKPF